MSDDTINKQALSEATNVNVNLKLIIALIIGIVTLTTNFVLNKSEIENLRSEIVELKGKTQSNQDRGYSNTASIAAVESRLSTAESRLQDTRELLLRYAEMRASKDK